MGVGRKIAMKLRARPREARPLLALSVVVALATLTTRPCSQPADASPDTKTVEGAVELLARLPLMFVPEQASADGPTAYVVRGHQATVWLNDQGLRYSLHPSRQANADSNSRSWVVALDLVGATPRQPVGVDPLPTRVSFFKGPRALWRTGLPAYGSVIYRQPWPGVDMVVSGSGGELKSSFVVRPEADPAAIRLAYRGATELRLDLDGSLVCKTPFGEIREHQPLAYQDVDGRRIEVAAAFVLEPATEPGRRDYRFQLGEYDPARELVVDPVTFVYCGYIGGSNEDVGLSIAVDRLGSAYIAGSTVTDEATFPVEVGPDLSFNGGIYGGDAFVAKINAAGTDVVYCGYIGGSGEDQAFAIDVDSAGRAYVVGRTVSSESSFPVTVGPDLTHNGHFDAFVARVDATGTMLDYCGYIGGSTLDHANGIAVDAFARAHVAGFTLSTEATFPVAVGPDLAHNGDVDAFVSRVNATGSALEYCGFIGGFQSEQADGIAVDAAGHAYVTGNTTSDEASFPVAVGPDLQYNGGASGDAYVARIEPDGVALGYCGYIGGSQDDYGHDIDVSSSGYVYIVGATSSTEADFPVTVGPDVTHNGGGWEAFVAMVGVIGKPLHYCGYIGGMDLDYGYGIAVDAGGRAHVTGRTRSTEATFPVSVGPDLMYNGGFLGDAFVAGVSPRGSSLDYCGYIGGSEGDFGQKIAVDAIGNAYIAGYTDSTSQSFPVTVGPYLTEGGDYDAFVAKVSSPDLLFSDGFESGDTSAWSAAVP
jgi:hypothetical protein